MGGDHRLFVHCDVSTGEPCFAIERPTRYTTRFIAVIEKALFACFAFDVQCEVRGHPALLVGVKAYGKDNRSRPGDDQFMRRRYRRWGSTGIAQ